MTAMSTAGYSGFPAYSQLHFPRSLLEGAVPGHESGTSTLGTFVTTQSFLCVGQVISAWLCMSPCRSDYIFNARL